MKINKYLQFTALAAILTLAALPCNGKVYRNVKCQSEGISLIADSIDCRSDLTRLYGRLAGMPHTAQRIDTLTIKIDNRAYGSTDIDGIDLKRWFQWEDEGEIPVEIDFPRLRLGKSATVEAVSPRGNCRWTLIIE